MAEEEQIGVRRSVVPDTFGQRYRGESKWMDPKLRKEAQKFQSHQLIGGV